MGVQALAAGTERMVAAAWPDAVVEFQNYGGGPSPRRFGAKTSLKLAAGVDRELSAWLRGYDLVIDTGAGDSFADIYGMRRFLEMSLVRTAAFRAGIPVVFGPQTIGPFNGGVARALASRHMRRAALVVARDSESVDMVRGIPGTTLSTSTDVVFYLPVEEPAGGPRDVLLNASGLLWNPNPHVDSVAYREQTFELCRGLLDAGREVSLLAHVVASDNPDDDTVAIRDLKARFGDAVEVLEPANLLDARALITTATVLVGSRMHACLNAISQGIPAVPLAYSRKFAPLLGDLGVRETIDVRTTPQFAAPALAAVERLRSSGAAEVAHVAETARARNALAVEALRAVLA